MSERDHVIISRSAVCGGTLAGQPQVRDNGLPASRPWRSRAPR